MTESEAAELLMEVIDFRKLEELLASGQFDEAGLNLRVMMCLMKAVKGV